MKAQNKGKVTCCSTRQKIWGVIALGGLFACGLMLGLIWGGDSNIKTDNNVPVVTDKPTCVVIEEMLQSELSPETANVVAAHEWNISVYQRLIENGCPENLEKYQALIQREQAIIKALDEKLDVNTEQTCAEIETLLLQLLPFASNNSDDRIERAKVYANLSERGCAENSEKYVELAAKELEIARALRDDQFSEPETVEVVETYKRLEMKQAANEVFEKVQKLTDPAIDFIIQIQKIIEE